MSEELDVNKMAAEFVSQNIERFYNTGKDVLKGAADKARLHLNRSYKDYLECVAARYSKAKSFFIRNEPTNLYNFYVPIGISSEKAKLSNASIGAISAVSPFAVITGSGGSGKSVLMRHLLLDAIAQRQKVPVILELRELNQTEQSLLHFIKETLHSNRFTLDDDYIEKALKAGHFALLFDGFDELAPSTRKGVRKRLFELAKNYDQNVILLSSRPDQEFSGWPAFSVFSMDALTLGQAVDLVEKLPFDSDLKTKFLKDLQSGLFEKHRSFLSNPLLLSIMLLTYGESADIPNKLSIFYSQAYETLFQRHDALKAGFQRERLTKLDIQDFGRVFSAFSIQTFDQRLFQMSATQALEYLERTKKITSIDFNVNDYLKDAEQAVCLLVEDGLMVAFSHRSFQEYFAARFIFGSSPDIQQKLVDKYSRWMALDSVFQLLYEMNPELVERSFLIPHLERLEQVIEVKRKVGISHYMRLLKNEYGTIRLRKDGSFLLGLNFRNFRFHPAIRFAINNCGHLIDFTELPESARDKTLWDKYKDRSTVRVSSNGSYLVIPTSKLNSRDEIVKYLATSNIGISKNRLQAALAIKDRLVKKHQELDQSLDKILDL